MPGAGDGGEQEKKRRSTAELQTGMPTLMRQTCLLSV